MLGWIRAIFKTEEKPKKPQKPAEILEELLEVNDDILDGAEFCATLSCKTPSRYLKLHGAVKKTLTQKDKDIDPAFGVYLPKVNERFAIPGFEGTQSSEFGPIKKKDVPACIRSLLEIRAIVEREMEPEGNLLVAKKRAAELLELKSHFEAEEEAFMFILSEITSSKIKYLSFDHYMTLMDMGYKSTRDILSANRDHLLRLKGIGPKKADSILLDGHNL